MYRFKLWHEAAGEYEIKAAPVGWDAMEFFIERDKKLHGLKVDYTLDLDFVKDGFDYISSVYETFGIQANVLIFVYEGSRLGFHYELVYTGTIAYDKWSVTDFPRKGTANIDFVGFTHKFLNNEDTTINLQSTTSIHGRPMVELNMVEVSMHSQSIRQGYDALKEVSSSATTFMVQDNEFAPATQLFSFGFDKVEKNELGIIAAGDGWLNEVADAPLLESKVAGRFSISMKLNGSVFATNDRPDGGRGDFDTMEVKVIMRKNNETPIVLFGQKKTGIQESHTIFYAVDRTVTVELVAGDKLFLSGWCNLTDRTSPTPGLWEFKVEHIFDKDSWLKMGASTTTDSSASKGVLIHEAFARICESITGYRQSFYSEFFGRTDSDSFQYAKDGEGSMLMVTNGFALRGFPMDYDPLETDAEALKRYIHTSFKDLYDAVDAIYCLGVGIEKINGVDTIRIEKREHFYRKAEVSVVLGKASKLTKTVASEYYFKEATFGYNSWKIEDVNGLMEFNAKQTWTTPITKVKNKYEAICDYITSGYKIEKIRRERYTVSDTTDTSDDDNMFFITLVRDGYGYRTATNEGVASVSGIANEGAVYNLRLSPAEMLRNHLHELSASYYKSDGKLYFSKGEGNYKMKYTDVSGYTIENGVDVSRENIGDAYFIPEIYEFEAPLNQFQVKTMRENPYALVKFMDSSGAVLSGFLQELKYISKEKLGKFKLLRAL